MRRASAWAQLRPLFCCRSEATLGQGDTNCWPGPAKKASASDMSPIHLPRQHSWAQHVAQGGNAKWKNSWLGRKIPHQLGVLSLCSSFRGCSERALPTTPFSTVLIYCPAPTLLRETDVCVFSHRFVPALLQERDVSVFSPPFAPALRTPLGPEQELSRFSSQEEMTDHCA